MSEPSHYVDSDWLTGDRSLYSSALRIHRRGTNLSSSVSRETTLLSAVAVRVCGLYLVLAGSHSSEDPSVKAAVLTEINNDCSRNVK